MILLDQPPYHTLLSHILIRLIGEGSGECGIFTLRDVGKMIELDNMDPEMEELEPDTKGRKSEIGRLYEDDDRSGGK
jgi:hypothetical protein